MNMVQTCDGCAAAIAKTLAIRNARPELDAVHAADVPAPASAPANATASVRSVATRNLRTQLDSGVTAQRRKAEKHIARVVRQHAIVRGSGRRGIPAGKLEEVFESSSSSVYCDLDVSMNRVKRYVYMELSKWRKALDREDSSSDEDSEDEVSDEEAEPARKKW